MGSSRFRKAPSRSLAFPSATARPDLPKLRARIGMVFQHFELFPHLTVMRNLELAQIKVFGRSQDEAAAKGMRLLERVGLSAHARKYPGELSGGQQQRVALRVRSPWIRSPCYSTSRPPRNRLLGVSAIIELDECEPSDSPVTRDVNG
jgi:ABC-type arginine transport system ATPase subunit